jgi:hypothetical protein
MQAMIIMMTAAAILAVPTVQQECAGALAGTWKQVSMGGIPRDSAFRMTPIGKDAKTGGRR